MDRHLANPGPGPGHGRRGGRLVAGLVMALAASLLPATAGAATDPTAASTPVPELIPPPVHTAGPVDLEADTVELESTEADVAPDEPAPSPAPDTVAAGSVHTVDLVPGTQMIGFSWTGVPAASIEFRTRDHGSWSAWETFEADPGEGPDAPSERSGDAPVWLGGKGSDQVEVRMGDQDLPEFEVLRMHWDESEYATGPAAEPEPAVEPETAVEPEAGTEPEPGTEPENTTAGPTLTSTARATGAVASATPVPQPRINLRSTWAPDGWRSDISGCGSSVPYNSSISHAVVHHTATSNSYSQAQVPGIIAGMYRYHTDSLRWCDLAYNFVVDKYGGIWQGRSGDLNRFPQGGHARGFNSTSVGVTLLGQYHPGASPTADRPTDVQISSLQQVLAWKLDQAGIDPTGTARVTSLGSTRYPSGTSVTLPTINPHQDTSFTACPGTYVMERMAEVRTGTKALIAAQSAPPPAPPAPPPPPAPPAPPPPPAAPWAPFSSPNAYVRQQAGDLYGRPPTDVELWTYVVRFGQGRSAGEVGEEMAGRPAAVNHGEPVVRLYHVAFDRIPDSPHFLWWRTRLRDGASLNEVASSLAGTQEFSNRYGHLGNAAYVAALYQLAIGRAPTGLEHVQDTARLDRRQVTRAQLLLEFSEAPTLRWTSHNRVRVVTTYYAMLGRVPPPANLANWSSRPLHEMVTAIVGLREYRDRATLS
jgi:hypothetical protein